MSNLHVEHRRPGRLKNGQTNTLRQILAEVNQVKPCTRQNLYFYLHALEIKPIGPRQRPQNYPADTSKRIIDWLSGAHGVVTLKQLREARRRARK